MFSSAVHSYCLKGLKLTHFVASTSSDRLDNNLTANAVFSFLLQRILNSPFLHLLETNKYLVPKDIVVNITKSTFYKLILQYSSKLLLFYKNFICPLHDLHWIMCHTLNLHLVTTTNLSVWSLPRISSLHNMSSWQNKGDS